jgi:SAM-dependent methyltransferase
VKVVDGAAEHLPFPDAAFDTLVASLVLCTVPDLAQTLAEARRVLRPAGRCGSTSTSRVADPRLARWQDRLERPGAGWPQATTPNRDITAAGFRLLELDRFDFQIMPPLVPPRPRRGGATRQSRLHAAGQRDESSTKERPRNWSDLGARCGG